jgi:hypothetical protein
MVDDHSSWRLPRRGGCRLVSRMERKLWVLRQRGGQIELDLPVVAAVVDGELRSKVEGARGVAPANGPLAIAYLVLRDECLLWLFP